MQTFPLSSSLLKSGAYDDATRELRITFKNGATWAYADVPEDEAAALQSASSPGQYFLQSIKGAYSERRV